MTEIEYDNQIWTTFSVGIISSVVILYYFHNNQIPENWGIWALALGFSVLVYSFFLILGYGVKKSIRISDEDYIRSQELARRWYPRTRFMAEIILIIIGYFYFKSFSENGHLPIIILLIAFLLNYYANYRARKNFENPPERREEWQDCYNYFREYFFK